MKKVDWNLEEDAQLTSKAGLLLRGGIILYLVLLALMCFLPQVSDGMETPGIQHFGRLVVLLVPFNSLVNLGQVTTGLQLFKIIIQNLMNIFLLFPLILQLLWIYPALRRLKRVLVLSFSISLFIECSQLLLDFFLDANRVFELDDLWTNTLGGYLAWLVFQKSYACWQKTKKSS
ncbi:VanZ family protein [Streptococcus oricebi]|uniref:VanZ-like domain-containing protein n=1 Tax=Streptococcus oricebi TaxID=1547447 RepID=A0ABS5B1P6_9STRE|nr:VanZ family protein [Streptococcus oricebi]MBP2622749.1 hypothetical protein [Streptococcus oricebi]